MQPQKPLRLVRPVRLAPQSAAETSAQSSDSQPTSNAPSESQELTVPRSRPPISPPDRPMQYRAIGLIEGQYHPSEDQLTRGMLQAKDGTQIDAVLLGRVMSLVRKHLETDKDYIWVVYPRTREQTNDLHMQIVGVWAPEEMGQVEPDDDSAVVPDFFSIRGEVIFQSRERGFIIVKIWQSSRKNQPAKKPMAFKLRLEGQLEGNAVGQFWDLTVRRQGAQLFIAAGTALGPAARPFHRKPMKRPRGKFPQPRSGEVRTDPNKYSGIRPPKPKLRSKSQSSSSLPPTPPEK
ncbi:MAG: hypothetical protein AAFY57_09460 [Cyanobacteria bacterium J06642_2]